MTLQRPRKAYDPDNLARELVRMFITTDPAGFIVGRMMLRDGVMKLLECTQREADEVVDTLILRGRLVFMKASEETSRLAVRPPGSEPPDRPYD